MAELQATRDVSKVAMIIKKEKKAAQRANESTVNVSNSPPKIKHPIFQALRQNASKVFQEATLTTLAQTSRFQNQDFNTDSSESESLSSPVPNLRRERTISKNKRRSKFSQRVAEELSKNENTFDESLDARNKLLNHQKLIKQINLQKRSRQFNGNNGT